MTKEKKCSKCGEVKGLDDFHKANSRRDGLRSNCKTCVSVSKKKYDKENKESKAGYMKGYHKNYKQANRGIFNAQAAKRNARKRNATPKWLTEEQGLEIKLIYNKAKELENVDGVKRHVDHIVPLKGKGVRGLHVPWNLQILTAEQNLSKNNSYSGWN